MFYSNFQRDIFARPLVHELQQNGGVLREGNLLDPNFTNLPALTYADLMEITLGPYQAEQTEAYITSIQVALLTYIVYLPNEIRFLFCHFRVS